MDFDNISINDAVNYTCQTHGVLIDVRNENDYHQGHLPLAINIPYDRIERGCYSLYQDCPLILYCERGGRSMLACKCLMRQGYHVVNTVGGMLHYSGPIEN